MCTVLFENEEHESVLSNNCKYSPEEAECGIY